jgi:tryptophanyl-tRNA synthetase
LLATEEQQASMRENYKTKGYGYGHAKTALLDLILTRFEKERERYNYFEANPDEVDAILAKGAERARKIARETLNRVRKSVGFYPIG